MKATLINSIILFTILQIMSAHTNLPLMYRFTEPGTLPQVYKTITPYQHYSKVQISGLLRNLEIADDGRILGINTGNNVYTWPSVSGWFTHISGNLYQASIGALNL